MWLLEVFFKEGFPGLLSFFRMTILKELALMKFNQRVKSESEEELDMSKLSILNIDPNKL